MKRIFDLILSIFLIILFLPLIIIISIFIKLESKGPIFYWSKRVGRNNEEFSMPKFRSMRVDAPQVATHLLTNSDQYITKLGLLLRKTSLDELPQLLSIFLGDMSFVGPRPALFNQYDLMELRTRLNIHTLIPGLTGWAQVNGRDDISNEQKVELDLVYLNNRSMIFDLKIILRTFSSVIFQRGIKH